MNPRNPSAQDAREASAALLDAVTAKLRACTWQPRHRKLDELGNEAFALIQVFLSMNWLNFDYLVIVEVKRRHPDISQETIEEAVRSAHEVWVEAYYD